MLFWVKEKKMFQHLILTSILIGIFSWDKILLKSSHPSTSIFQQDKNARLTKILLKSSHPSTSSNYINFSTRQNVRLTKIILKSSDSSTSSNYSNFQPNKMQGCLRSIEVILVKTRKNLQIASSSPVPRLGSFGSFCLFFLVSNSCELLLLREAS